uniref:Uncharacterized protein n=1 Tax=Panagrolaimus sp. JU765 TaxID=591449 RepID=A0AC34RFL2_9BILA
MDELLIDSGIRSEIKNRINTSKNSIDEMGKKIDSMKNAAMSSKNQGDELLDEYENAIEWINNANEELNGYSGLTADNEKLKEQIDKFDDFYKTGLEKEGSMMLLKAKMAEAIDKSTNSKEMKEKLEILGKSWDPLLNSIKEKYSKMKNLKELIDEFGDLEVEIKNNLSKIQSDLEEFKEKEKTNENLPENLETTKEILNLTKPKIDGLFNLSKKIDTIAPGPDSKKLNRDVENLLNDYDVLAKELTNQTKIIQTKNDLKNNFEKLIISATKMLENVEQTLKNDDLKKSKEKLQNLDEDVKNNFSKMKREIDSTIEKLKSIVDEKEMEEMNSKVNNLEMFYGQIIDQISKLLIEISKNDEIVTSTMEKNYDLKNEIENIGEQILDLQSIGRDMNEL